MYEDVDILDLLNMRISFYIKPNFENCKFITIKDRVPDLNIDIKGFKCCLIHESNFSKVYMCISPNGERFSIKTLKDFDIRKFKISKHYEDNIYERFIREVEIMSKLEHPNILRLYDYSTTVPLAIYEFADGLSLEYQIRHGWYPSFKDILLILIQISHAIKYIHDVGIYHCDIKLSNILICDGVVKLCDFNTCVDGGNYVRCLETCTKCYCTPEHFSREYLHKNLHGIDVYQLANVLLRLLCGICVDGRDRLYMSDIDVVNVLSCVKNIKSRDLIFKMLSRDPSKRPSIEYVLRELVNMFYEV